LELVLVVIDPQLCLHTDNAPNALLCLASIVLPQNVSPYLEFHDTTDFLLSKNENRTFIDFAIENDVNATQALSRVLRTFYYGTGNFVLGAAWSVAEMLRFLNQ
jgi:hypothetical protein